MKKILLIATLLTLITSANFAQGFTQYDLAELLVNKAIAEGIIEDKDYSEDEIISLVESFKFFTVTDPLEEISFEVVREKLSAYEEQKDKLLNGKVEEPTVEIEEVTYNPLEDEDRLLSHEFMQRTYEDRNFNRELEFFQLDGKKFTIPSDEKYPLLGKYRYELYRIFGWYAREYNMYVSETTSSVALYRRKSDVESQAAPLIIVGFSRNPTDDNYDGVAYSVRMKVNALYNVKYNPEESLAEYRERIVATGFKQAHLVMALKDATRIFIKDESELNAFVDSYVADVVENEGKEYSYDKDRHEIFNENRYFISKIQGYVFYYLDFDLSTWED